MRANRGENAFAGWTKESRDESKPEEKEKPAAAAAVKPAKRKWKFPYKKPADLETEITTVEGQIAILETALQDVELYKDADRFRQTLTTLEATKEKLATLLAHWEEAVERQA